MIILDVINSDFFFWVVLPVLIFLARIVDQSIGTIRLIFSAKGFKTLASSLAFFESLIWLIAVSQILKHLDNIFCYIAYAGGFATGSYVGMLVEEKLSIGNVVIRIIPKKDTTELIKYLREQNYGVTSVDVEGMLGPTKMVFTTIPRKEIKHVVEIINHYNPMAFYTIEEVQAVSRGFFKNAEKKSIFSLFNHQRKKGK